MRNIIEKEGKTFRQVPFEIMIQCDGEIICHHWVLNNSINKFGVDLTQPMVFNVFLKRIGSHLTSLNCKSVLQHAKWFVIDDGVQIEFYSNMEDDKNE